MQLSSYIKQEANLCVGVNHSQMRLAQKCGLSDVNARSLVSAEGHVLSSHFTITSSSKVFYIFKLKSSRIYLGSFLFSISHIPRPIQSHYQTKDGCYQSKILHFLL